jgi:hypothetical protein
MYIKDSNLSSLYADMARTKHFDGIIFDAIFTEKHILIKPVSKVPLYATAITMLSTPLFLGGAVEVISEKITSFLAASSKDLVGTSVEIDILKKLPMWKLSNLKSVKQSVPTLLKPGATAITFSNALNVEKNNMHCNLSLVFDGSATFSKNQFKDFPRIATLCKFNLENVSNF